MSKKKGGSGITSQQLDAWMASGKIKSYTVTSGKGAGATVVATDPPADPVAVKNGPKYGNKKVIYDGLAFDSILERDRWIVLSILEKKGIIQALKRQVVYHLEVDRDGQLHHVCDYIADFTYYLVTKSKATFVVEDTKSAPVARRADFRLKKKLMMAIHGLEIKLVSSPV